MKSQKRSTFAFLSFCFIAYMTTGVNTIIQTLINAFPDISPETARLSATLPALSTLITSLISGFLVGKKVNFKTLYLLACGLFTLGGLMPIFLYSRFVYILISRFIFGCGTGLCLSYNAYALSYYPKESQAKMMGWALFMCNIGSVVSQLAAGALAEISWKYAFLIYLLSPVVLLIVAFLLEEPVHAAPAASGTKEDDGKKAFVPAIVIYVLFGVMGGLWIGPINSSMSIFIAEHGFGSSLMTGVILSVYTLAGALGGSLLDQVKKLGKYAAGFALLCVSLGFLVIVKGGNLVMVGTGAALCGFGYMISKPLFTIHLSSEVSARTMTFVSTILLSTANLGLFLSNGWIRISDFLMRRIPAGEVDRSFFCGAIMFGAGAVFLLVYHSIKYRRRPEPGGD